MKSDQQVCRRVVMFVGRHYYRQERRKRKQFFKRLKQKILKMLQPKGIIADNERLPITNLDCY